LFRIFVIVAATYGLIVLQACGNSGLTGQSERERTSPNKQEVMSKQEAIAIAENQLRAAGHLPNRYRVVACEQSNVWRIIFDGGGPEYLISKADRKVLASWHVPQESADNSEDPSKSASAIGKDEAIAATKADAQSAYRSLDGYNVVACELKKSWRIIYDLNNDTVVGGGPEYVVEKRSGKIIHKKYFQ
jgi:hypothetical protein